MAEVFRAKTAMVAGLSSAARLGVLVKSVVDLEAARNLTAMVFDKTGTLTTGELQVTAARPSEGVEGAELLALAGAAEQNSRHPVARAVTDVARMARVGLQDDIGVLLESRATAICLGERPGLGTGDSLSIYIAIAPKLDQDNADKNCISNVRPAGLSPEEAAAIAADMLERGLAAGKGGLALT